MERASECEIVWDFLLCLCVILSIPCPLSSPDFNQQKNLSFTHTTLWRECICT